jgi:ribosome-associated protein
VHLTEKQKQTISNKLKNRLDGSGNLSVSSSTSRSQFNNKKLATDRFFSLLETSLKKEKPRKSTTIPPAIKAKRLDNKKHRSKVKTDRSFKPDQ